MYIQTVAFDLLQSKETSVLLGVIFLLILSSIIAPVLKPVQDPIHKQKKNPNGSHWNLYVSFIKKSVTGEKVTYAQYRRLHIPLGSTLTDRCRNSDTNGRTMCALRAQIAIGFGHMPNFR